MSHSEHNRIQPKIQNAELKPLSQSNFVTQNYPDQSVQQFYEFILNKLKYWSYQKEEDVQFDLGQFYKMLRENELQGNQQQPKIVSEIHKDIAASDSLKLLYNQAIKPDEVQEVPQINQNYRSINDVDVPQHDLQQNFIHRNNEDAQNRRRNLLPQEPFTSLNSTQYCDILVKQEFEQLNTRNQIITWRIRSCVFMGLQQLCNFLAEACRWAYELIKMSFNRIVSMETLRNLCKKTDPQEYESRIWNGDYFNIVQGIRNSISIPFYMVYTFIGFPLYTINSYNNNQSSIQETDYQLKTKFQKQVEDRINQNRSKYIDMEFFSTLSYQHEVFSQMEFNQFDEQKFLQYINEVKGNIKFEANEKSYKLQWLRLQQFYMEEITIQLRSLGYNEEFCNSFQSNFLSYVILNYYSEILEKRDSEARQCLQDLIEEFQSKGLTKQYELLKVILEEYKKVYDASIQEEISQQQPHQQKKIEQIPANHLRFEYLIIDQSFSISTNFIFWKIIWVILFTFEAMFFIIYHGFDQALNGCFGLKVVFLRQFGRHSTVSQMYSSITESVHESIDDFEREPNDGILDKGITRICHRIYNYVFKYLICGVIFVGIFLRLAFTLFSIILILLTPIAALLSPFYAILGYLFSVFIYDFLSPERNNTWNIPIILPFFNLIIFRLLIMSVGRSLLCIVLFFGYYILSICIIFLSFFFVMLRLALNVPSFLVLWLCGRMPNSDTWAAQKVRVEDANDEEQANSSLNNSVNHLVVQEQEPIREGNIQDAYTSHMQRLQRSIHDKDYQKLTPNQIVLIVSSELKKTLIENYEADMKKYINQPMLDNETELASCMPFVEKPSLGKITQMYLEKTKVLLDKFNKDMGELEKKIPVYNKKDHHSYPFYYSEEEYLQIFKQLKDFLEANQALFSSIMWKDCEQKQVTQGNFDHLTSYYLNHIFFNQSKRASNIKEQVMKSKQPISIETLFKDFCPNSSYNCKTKRFLLFTDFVKDANELQKVEQPVISIENLWQVTLVNAANIHQ